MIKSNSFSMIFLVGVMILAANASTEPVNLAPDDTYRVMPLSQAVQRIEEERRVAEIARDQEKERGDILRQDENRDNVVYLGPPPQSTGRWP